VGRAEILQVAVKAALPIDWTARKTIKAAKLFEKTRPMLAPANIISVMMNTGRRPSVLQIGIQKNGAMPWKTMNTVRVSITTASLTLNSYKN
jgi:hypothetical protein